jgi:hypothetical protein
MFVDTKTVLLYRFAFVLSGVRVGATANAGTHPGWIMRPGDPADCKNAPAKAWPGNWLAMKQMGGRWSIAHTIVSIVQGEYRSSEPADYLIEASWQVAPGPVSAASISRRKDDFLFDFDGVNYEWVQAAGAHYYLTDGTSYWNDARLEMHRSDHPIASPSKQMHRCGFYDGCHELLWAGDINRDGKLDLIVRFNEGEDAGLQLWLGEQDGTGLDFQTADRGPYQYNMSFICAFRKR